MSHQEKYPSSERMSQNDELSPRPSLATTQGGNDAASRASVSLAKVLSLAACEPTIGLHYIARHVRSRLLQVMLEVGASAQVTVDKTNEVLQQLHLTLLSLEAHDDLGQRLEQLNNHIESTLATYEARQNPNDHLNGTQSVEEM